MEEIIYYNSLYDLYGELLTEKQRKYFEDYYFNNFSYSEIAENYHVSRNAAFKQLHNVLEKLEDYEKKLKLLEKRELLKKIVSKISDIRIKNELENLF